MKFKKKPKMAGKQAAFSLCSLQILHPHFKSKDGEGGEEEI